MKSMLAMVLHGPGQPLRKESISPPSREPGQVVVRISCCAVCRTDLHVVDGELPHPKLPLIPGHEIVGHIEDPGESDFNVGERVGIPWLGWTCGQCSYCLSARENLCPDARFTGYTLDGGYAEFVACDARFCFPLPGTRPDSECAPLLCAGLIGHRSLVKAGDPHHLGIYGFGAAAHLVAQVARHEGREVFAFTREGDLDAQNFARSLGVAWAGDSTAAPPEPLDAAIIFAPAGHLVPVALRAVKPGGTVVCGGIHMSDIPSFPYEYLWHERQICSVANLTRQDATDFLSLAGHIPLDVHIQEFPLTAANEALTRLRTGRLSGAAVLRIC